MLTNNAPSLPPELTISLAADVLGVSRPTLMKWVNSGEIDSFNVGSHVQLTRDEVLRVKEERQRNRVQALNDLRELEEQHGITE